MADGYNGDIKLQLDIETKEAEKRFDKLAGNIKSRTSEITKDAGNDMRKAFQETASAAKEITPELDKMSKATMKQADAVDTMYTKQQNLLTSVDDLKFKYDKSTEAIYNQRAKVQELQNTLDGLRNFDIKSKTWADLEATYNRLQTQAEKHTEEWRKMGAEIASLKERQESGIITPAEETRLRDLEEDIYPELIHKGLAIDNSMDAIAEKLEAMQANPELIPEVQKYETELAGAEAILNRLQAEREAMASEGEQKLTAEAQSLANAYGDADNNADNLLYTTRDIVEAQNEEYNNQFRIAEVSKIEEEEAEETLETTKKQSRVLLKLRQFASSVADKFREMRHHAKATRSSTDLIDRTVGKLYRKLWGMIRRVFIFSVITKALRKIRSALSSIFSSDTEMATYFSKIKANLLTAFAPLWDYVVPLIKQVLSMLVSATATLAKVMSAIFSRTVKSSQDSAKALEAQAKATDKTKAATDGLNKSLGHLDELNTDISTENATADEDTGSGLTYEDMEVSQEILDRVEKLKSVLSDLFDPIRKSWEKNKGKLKASVKRTFEELKRLAGDVGSSFMEVWTNGTAEEAFDHILGTVTNLVDTVGNLAGNFADAWEKGDRGTSIIQHIGDLFNTVLGHVESITQSLKDWSATIDFEPILTAFDDLLVALQPFVDMTLDGLQWILDNILLPLATWAIEQAIPGVLDLVSQALDTLGQAADACKPFLDWLWNDCLKPLGEWTGGIIIGALDGIKGLLKGIGDWIRDNKDSVGEFIQLFGMFATPVLAVWGAMSLLKMVVPLVQGVLATLAASMLAPAGIVMAILAALAAIIVFEGNGEEAIENLKSAFGGLLDFITGVFTGDWEKALHGLADVCIGVCNLIIIAVESILNIVIDALNAAFPAIVKAIGTVTNIPFVGEILGDTISSFATLPRISLPRVPTLKEQGLAHGTVVPASSKEFLALLGDNNTETEVVSPLSTMKEALMEALAAYGGLGGEQQITLQIDGNDLFRWLIQKNKETYLQTGQNMLIY